MAADRRRAEALAEVTFELTEFLVDVLGVTDTGSRFEGKLTYHACVPHAARDGRGPPAARAAGERRRGPSWWS